MRMVLLAALFLCGGCQFAADTWGPSEPAGGHRVPPDTSFLGLWKQVEACSGLRGRMRRVRWFLVEGDVLPVPTKAAARWMWPHDIYVAQAHWANAIAIRHEMLHDLNRDGSHPVRLFGPEGCGDLVTPK